MRLVRVGKVAKPHGVKGEIKVFAYGGDPAVFREYPRIQLAPARRDDALSLAATAVGGVAYEVRRARSQGRYAVLALAGVADRDRAEDLAGLEVWVAEDLLPPPADDEFYWHQVVGLAVVTKAGRSLGRVQRLMATGGHDILVVADGQREYLIPALDEFIVDIDLEAGRLLVDPVEGLLDINP